MTPDGVLASRNGVGLSFALNGLVFATLVSRVPAVREHLALGNGALGLLLLAIAAGSVLALPTTGLLVHRRGAAAVVRLGAGLDVAGLLLAAVGAAVAESVPLAAAGLFVHGVGTGVWDVAMNLEAAEVERGLGRTVMPRFHAGWSLGSIVGAGLGVAAAAAEVAVPVHLGAVGLVALVLAVRSAGAFLPVARPSAATAAPAGALAAWREPRTLAIGVMVLAFAMVEGSANDWLSLALIDGHDVPHWAGVAGYAGFVCAMTGGRLAGPLLLDRVGRPVVLWACTAGAAAGVLLVVLGEHPVAVAAGILLWGLGASLGFPVGISAAADEAARAPARVSVVSTIGYGAFLAGPPLLGLLGDRVGTLRSLLVVVALMVPAAVTVAAARPAATRSGAGRPAVS